ncbi:MAG: N-acetylmuramoyl-L-alanine amidase [Eubacteriales bacterium]
MDSKTIIIPCILFVCVIAGIVGTLFLTMPVIKTVTATTDPASRIIILDAGHGGEDGGTSSTDGTKEKDINLAVTLRLKAMLESAGFQVKMTRETDIAVNDPNLDTVKQRKVSDIKNRLKLIQNTPNCILSVFIKIIFRNPNTTEHKYFTLKIMRTAKRLRKIFKIKL